MTNLFIYFGYVAYSVLSRLMPLKLAYKFADFIGYLVFKLESEENNKRADIIKKISKKNISSYHARKLICKSIQYFNKDLVDFFKSGRLNERNIDDFVKIKGLEYLDEALSKGRGVVIASAHVGSWEMAGIALAIKGYPICGMVWESENKLVADLLTEVRLKKGVKIVKKTNLRAALDILQKNNIIGIMVDINGGINGIPHSEWGYDLMLPQGVAAISMRCNAELLTSVILRDDVRGYNMYIDKPKTYNSIEDTVVSVFNHIKEYIELNPVQWHWVKYFFEGANNCRLQADIRV